MQRIPRFGVVLAGAAVLAALLLASSATGRSQAKPSNQQEPFIATKIAVVVGAKLTGDKGSWDGTEPITYSFQWLRCNENAINCKDVTNATGTQYTVVQADVGNTLRFQVTAKNSDGSATAMSNATGEVPGKANAPAEITAPSVSGSAVVGQQLTTTNGTWAGTQPINYTINWQSCNTAVTSCSGTGKKGSTYTVAAADVGRRSAVQGHGQEQRRLVDRALRHDRGRRLERRRRWRRRWRRREHRQGRRRRAGGRAPDRGPGRLQPEPGHVQERSDQGDDHGQGHEGPPGAGRARLHPLHADRQLDARPTLRPAATERCPTASSRGRTSRSRTASASSSSSRRTARATRRWPGSRAPGSCRSRPTSRNGQPVEGRLAAGPPRRSSP